MYQAGLRMEDRLFQVTVIDQHSGAIGKRFIAAIQPLPSRTETVAAILAMAGAAAVLFGQLPAFFQHAVPTGLGSCR
ncbi:hypothetical protein D3C84_1117310 [compost metagenome]